MPPGGLNIRPGRHALEKEELLHRWKKPAALAFIRENGLDRIMMRGGPKPRLGIVSLGKSWLDTLPALDLLGIDEKRAADLGAPALQGRGAVAARAGGRQPLRRGAARRSSSSRRSARWSRRRSRSSFTAAPARRW